MAISRIVKIFVKGSIYMLFMLFTAVPLYVFWRILCFSNYTSYQGVVQFLSMFPGYIGYFMRQTFYKIANDTGRNFDLGFGSMLVYPDTMIRHDVTISVYSEIAKCSIGSDVKIGSNVYVVNKQTHDIAEDGTVLPTNIDKLERIHIGRNTWIGNSSVILADVGKNCIIGSGSVVVKPIPDNCVAVGNPAKIIRKNDH